MSKERRAAVIQTDTAMQIRDIECEEAVLATLLSDVNAFDRLAEYLSVDCFCDSKHREVYKAIVSLQEAGEPVDLITVTTQLGKEGSEVTPFDVAQLSSKAVNFLNQSNYVQHLKELSIRRNLWFIGQELVNAGTTEAVPLDEVQNCFKEKFDSLFDLPNSNVSTMRQGIEELCSVINANYEGEIGKLITKTGFSKLDEVRGLRNSDLVILAGDTSQGKTSFAQSLTLSAILQEKKVAFYSMEMTRLQLCARLISAVSGIPSNHITDQRLTDWEAEAFNKAVGTLPLDNLYFDDRSSSNVDMIISSIRTMTRKHGITGVVIDYLQILSVNGSSRQSTEEQQLGEIARRLKNLAKELDIFIVLLSQLNRDPNNPLPRRERLRGSGQIAEAADMVLLVYRPEVYGTQYPKPFDTVSTRGTAMIRVAKNRNGGLVDFICGFDSGLTKFFDMDSKNLREIENDPFDI